MNLIAALPMTDNGASALAAAMQPGAETPETGGFARFLTEIAATAGIAGAPLAPFIAAPAANGNLPVAGKILPPLPLALPLAPPLALPLAPPLPLILPGSAPAVATTPETETAPAVAETGEDDAVLALPPILVPFTPIAAMAAGAMATGAEQRSAAPAAAAPPNGAAIVAEAAPPPARLPALALRPDALAAQSAVFVAPQMAAGETVVRFRPASAEQVAADMAAPPAELPAAVPFAQPVATAPVSGGAPGIAAARTEAPQDFAALVERLVQARDAATPQAVQATIAHADFGQVSLRFERDGAGLSVALASADPDFARAAQAAVQTAVQTTSAATMGMAAHTGSGGHGSARSHARGGMDPQPVTPSAASGAERQDSGPRGIFA